MRTHRRPNSRTCALLVTLVFAVGLAGCHDSPASSDEPQTPSEATRATQAANAVSFTLASDAYQDGAPMPSRLARQGVSGGTNASPPLAWTGLPDGTASLALVMLDRHPAANEWIHWIVVDIPAGTTGLPEGASGAAMPQGARELENSWGDVGYGGPEPPAGTGEHQYEITIYALDIPSADLDEDAGFTGLLEVVKNHTLGAGTLSGYFGR